MGANPRIRGEMAEKVGGTLGKRPTNFEESVAMYSSVFLYGVHTLQVCEFFPDFGVGPMFGPKMRNHDVDENLGCETIFEARSQS